MCKGSYGTDDTEMFKGNVETGSWKSKMKVQLRGSYSNIFESLNPKEEEESFTSEADETSFSVDSLIQCGFRDEDEHQLICANASGSEERTADSGPSPPSLGKIGLHLVSKNYQYDEDTLQSADFETDLDADIRGIYKYDDDMDSNSDSRLSFRSIDAQTLKYKQIRERLSRKEISKVLLEFFADLMALSLIVYVLQIGVAIANIDA